MSLEQIIREFPFLKCVASTNHQDYWEDAVIEARVSRLSLEGLELTMEHIWQDNVVEAEVLYGLICFDKKGIELSDIALTCEFGFFATIGDALFQLFRHNQEWMEEVGYILYSIDRNKRRWRRYSGHKPGLYSKTWHRELILFKLPKVKTLRQLLEKHRKNKR